MPPGLTVALQLLLVVAADWAGRDARLHSYERADAAAPWVPVGLPLEVSLGRSGLAWAQEFVMPGMPPGPVKHEGDGCSPAGAFAITALFGYAAVESAAARAYRLPYLGATRDLKCIDDPASAHYNRIIDQSAVAQPDWASCEDMLRGDGRYEVGAVVGCNVEPVVPGAGSCIFLHVWAAPGVPTAGCTALAPADMRALAGWLDGAAAPLLVQLPQAAYARYRAAWGLPFWAA